MSAVKVFGSWRGATVVLGLLSMVPLVTNAEEGVPSSVIPTGSPSDASSGMYTLQDVCKRLDDGSTGNLRTGAFNEPTAGPEDTLCSLNELMEKSPTVADDAVSAEEVISGKTFWSLKEGAWGKQSGTATAGDHVTGAEGELSLNIPNGIYSGDKTATVTDSNLTSENIKSGSSVFGVAGSVVESTGDAIAANVLQDKTFSKAGEADLTGSMPNNGAVTVTPGTTDQAIVAGYHDGSGKVTGDANLTADNIKSGTSVFGVAGSVVESTGDAIAANVLQDKTFSKAGEADLTGSMPNNGAVTVTPSATDQSIAVGYHNGAGKVTGDANLIADNIKDGVTIFGVEGTVESGNTYSVAVAATGQTTSYATGDDGDTQIGAAVTGARFTDNSDGTVTDNLTGLIWLKNANCTDAIGGVTFSDQKLTWQDGLNFSAALSNGSCGLTDNSIAGDWRLPNLKEFQSLVVYNQYNPALASGHPFSSVQSYFYWSSTAAKPGLYSGGDGAFLLFMGYGNAGVSSQTHNFNVWPVRGGQ